MRSRAFSTLLALAAIGGLWQSTARAGILDGGFEGGLSGWTTSGPVFSTSLELERGLTGGPDWSPVEASRFAALFSTDGLVSAASLEQAFNANAGDALAFDYFFDFGDFSTFPDTARAELIGPSLAITLLRFNEAGGISLADFANVGWAGVNVPIPETGMYTLRFSIQDFNSTFESILGVDDVRVIPIPEPGNACLAIISLLILSRGCGLRRSQRAGIRLSSD